MKFSNIEWIRENWVKLFQELYSFQGDSQKSMFQLERYCKCINIDVRLVLRTVISFEQISETHFTISINTSLSTDCVSLRRSNYFWNDKENVTVLREIDVTDVLEDQFGICADELIEKISQFRICNTCRILYQDVRLNHTESMCVHCLYDAVFYCKDENCAICKYPIMAGEQTFTLTCAHTFHSGCILMHFIKNANRRECPLCRENDSHQL